MKMYIGVVGGGPLVGKNMNVVSSLGELLDIALDKLLGTAIKNKFLPGDSYFHGAGQPKELRVRIVQNVMINGYNIVHHYIKAQFFFSEGVSCFSHRPG